MGCSSCGSKGTDGKPSGCNSNGGCSSGGCNRMNVHDWLVNLPYTSDNTNCNIIEVSFNNGSRKEYYRNTTVHTYTKGDMIAVEGIAGYDVGSVSITGELVRMQLKKVGLKEDNADIKKILRRATDTDLLKLQENKQREADAVIKSRAIAKNLKLNMKVSEVEIQADGRKATFYYIADDRVDFRELIRLYASEFKVKVEMRQIGARQEAAKIGGIGSCGRELCCSTWLTEFKSVTTTAARYQNLSINQTKLSGQCGRLKCCLNFELDTYIDALHYFPDNADTLEFVKGRAHLIKKDIFKNLMWYTLEGSSKHYPLTIDKVKEVRQLNIRNIRPEEIEVVEVITNKYQEKEPEFVDVVGQISLQSLDKRERNKRRPQQQYNQPNNNPQRNNPNYNNRNNPNNNNPQRPQAQPSTRPNNPNISTEPNQRPGNNNNNNNSNNNRNNNRNNPNSRSNNNTSTPNNNPNRPNMGNQNPNRPKPNNPNPPKPNP